MPADGVEATDDQMTAAKNRYTKIVWSALALLGIMSDYVTITRTASSSVSLENRAKPTLIPCDRH